MPPDDVEAEVEAFERGQVLEGVLLNLTDSVVVKIDDLEIVEAFEAFLAQGLERVPLEDQLLQLGQSDEKRFFKCRYLLLKMLMFYRFYYLISIPKSITVKRK